MARLALTQVPKNADYWRVEWRPAERETPLFAYFDNEEEAVAVRDEIRNAGETAEVYRLNNRTSAYERLT